jgi:hypothetical protein
MSISLLEEFVWSLDKNERAKLKPLKFRGKKRQMLFALVKQKARNHTATKETKKKISTAALHSMRSELLEYCYQEICPDGGLQLLSFLVERGLYRHFTREVAVIERTVTADSHPDTIEKFYLEVFKLIHLIPLARLTNDVVWAKLREYPAKYVDSKQHAYADDHLLPEIFLLGLEMRQAINEHRPPELLSKIEQRLQSIYKQTQHSENVFLRTMLNRRMIIYYKNVKVDFENVQKYYEAEAFYFSSDPKVAEFIPQDMSNLYSAELAYFRSDFDTAYRYFNAEVQREGHTLRSWPVSYAQMYVLVCHIKKEYTLAEKILNERFLYFLDFYHSPHAVLACVLLARHHLYMGEYTRALEYIMLGYKQNVGSLFDPIHDLDLKIVENAIITIKGDFQHSHSLAQANVRVCARRGYQLSNSRLPNFFKIIEEISDSLLIKGPLPEKTKERLRKFATPFAYPKAVLDILIQKYYPKEIPENT